MAAPPGAASTSMTHSLPTVRAVPPAPGQTPDPNAARYLAAQYGRMVDGYFLPAVSFDLRVAAATANGVPLPQARAEAAAGVAADEARVRTHGTSWQFVCVTACWGAGTATVGGIDNSDAEGLALAETLALLRASEDAQDWTTLGLGDN